MTERDLTSFIEERRRILRRRRRLLRLTGAVAIVLLALGASVFAYFKATGSGTANASVGSLTPATISASCERDEPVCSDHLDGAGRDDTFVSE